MFLLLKSDLITFHGSSLQQDRSRYNFCPVTYEQILRLALERKSPDLSEGAVRHAVESFAKSRPEQSFYQADLHDIYQIAREAGAPDEELFASRGWPGRAALLEAIDPWIADVRRELEAAYDIRLPFDDVDQAADWIETESERRVARGPDPAEVRRQMRELTERCNELTEKFGAEVRWTSSRSTVAYYRSDSAWQQVRVVPRGSGLESLARSTAEMEKATGIKRSWLTACILADVSPPLSVATVTMSPHWREVPGSERPVSRLESTVRFHDPPTAELLRKVGERLRAEWGTSTKGRPVSENTRRIVALIERRGESKPVEEWSVEEWKAFRTLLEEEEGIVYKDYRGPRRAWERHRARREEALSF